MLTGIVFIHTFLYLVFVCGTIWNLGSPAPRGGAIHFPRLAGKMSHLYVFSWHVTRFRARRFFKINQLGHPLPSCPGTVYSFQHSEYQSDRVVAMTLLLAPPNIRSTLCRSFASCRVSFLAFGQAKESASVRWWTRVGIRPMQFVGMPEQ